MSASPSSIGVRVRTDESEVDVCIDLADPGVTMNEVFESLGIRAGTVDGRCVDEGGAVAARDVLVRGSLLAACDALVAGAAVADPDDRAVANTMEVAVVAGLDASHRCAVPGGVYRLRFAADSSGPEWLLDLASAAGGPGPWHEFGSSVEVLDVPCAGTVVVSRAIDGEVSPSHTMQRPPRRLPPDSVVPIDLPDSPEPVRPPAPLSWATLLAPVPIAMMMAIFFRPVFALFAAMGPVMALGRWYEDRRRFRRDVRHRAEAVASSTAQLAAALAAQAESIASLRWLRQPHVAELRRRASIGSVRLWERRRDSPGFLVAAVGVGPDVVAPLAASQRRLDDEIHAALNEPLAIRPVPHVVDLGCAGGAGIHGARAEALAVGRSLVLQLASLHGPADLGLGVVCPPDAVADWDWIKWLPHLDRAMVGHCVDTVGTALPGTTERFDRARSSGLTRTVQPSTIGGSSVASMAAPTQVVIIDDPNADVAGLLREAHRRGSDLRVVCIGADSTSLPAACDVLVSVADGRAQILQPGSGARIDAGAAIGLTAESACDWARSLARHADPEAQERVFTGISTIGLRSLVDVGDPDTLAARWRRRTPDEPPVVPVGVTAGGPATIDLVADGPHVLVAGTTGSGKSELLRTLVASLAVACPPDQLEFVLVDFKGGGAFDAVAQLPHVAGLITDLDETMIGRALNSLRAELVRREELLRSLGSSTFEDAAQRTEEPPARLVVVIDEFAALATDHPDLLAGIVDLAARGRSLGMHLVLATQRPSGVVDQKIRANTNLKIALRVQDAFDSQDVVGIADAATIDRRRPGRGYFRVASDPPMLVQTAFGGGADDRSERCAVRPLRLFDSPVGECGDRPAEAPGDSRARRVVPPAPRQLDVVVETVRAAAGCGWSPADQMWNSPLPSRLDWADVQAPCEQQPEAGAPTTEHIDSGVPAPSGAAVDLGLVDRPELRRHDRWRWDPASGALCIFGSSADCAAKALSSLGCALLQCPSGGTHLYVFDGGAGALAALEASPRTGAHVGSFDVDRVGRTVALLERAVAGRRSSGPTGQHTPRLVLLIDNIAAVLDQHDDVSEADLVDRLTALVRDGAPRGVHVAMTARSVRDVPHRLAQQIQNRLVMSLADPAGYLALGLRARTMPPLPPMRAVDVATTRVVQLVEPPADIELVAGQSTEHQDVRAERVRGFPSSVSVVDLPAARIADDGTVCLPIGVEGGDLSVAEIELRPARHALLVGAPGSGRSTTLRTLIDRAEAGRIDVVIVTPELASSAIDALAGCSQSTVVVIDDADRLSPEVAASCQALLADPGGAVIVAAVTPGEARSVRSWFSPIRVGGVGLLLGMSANEPDLLGARGERVPGLGQVRGRGRLVSAGRSVPVQVASPTAATDEVWLL